jgi:hypothetical protein
VGVRPSSLARACLPHGSFYTYIGQPVTRSPSFGLCALHLVDQRRIATCSPPSFGLVLLRCCLEARFDLREKGKEVNGVSVGAKAKEPERYMNQKADHYWRAREWVLKKDADGKLVNRLVRYDMNIR